MDGTVEILRQLHRIHRQLHDLADRRERGPRQVKAHEGAVTRLEDEVKKAQGEFKAARMAADDKQLQLRGKEDKIVQLQNKLSGCSTNREYQALQEQIAADQVAMSVLEDEILEALAKIDDFKPLIAKAEENFVKGKQEFEKIRQRVEDAKQSIEADMARLLIELKQTEQQLPADVRENYDRIVRAKGDDALAEVDNQICGGCYQQITPNAFSHLMMGRSVICGSCARLLYLAETGS
jgi:hypothetical protein